MWHRFILLILALVLTAPFATAQETTAERDPAGAGRPGGQERLFVRFLQDGAHAEDQPWYELHLVYQDLPGAKAWGMGFSTAVAPLPGLELGARLGLLDIDYSRHFFDRDTESHTGLTDLELAAKYRFGTGVSAGFGFTLPTGDEDAGLGSGKADGSLFLTTRTPFPRRIRPGSYRTAALDATFHLGFRFNDDTRILDHRLDGRTSLLAGLGLFWERHADLVAVAELVAETKRYEEAEWIGEVVVGLAWQVAGNLSVRPSVTVGLSDAAPDWVLQLGFAFRP
jgi:hypothetical protein